MLELHDNAHTTSLRDIRGVSLFDADPELAAAVDAADRDRARQALLARTCRVPAGDVDPTTLGLSESTFALLVLGGALIHEARAGTGRMVEFIARGDLLMPFAPPLSAIPGRIRLTATEDVRLAALDQRFVRAAAAWPGLMVVVQRRLSEQQHRLALHGAICQLPNAEQRLMAVLWHLADRIGVVTGEGIVLAQALSHRALADLIGARRPTVSHALGTLRDRGHIDRLADGMWLLPHHTAHETDGFDDLLARVTGDGLAGAV